MARARTFDPMRIKRLIDAKRVGATNRDACRYAGISESTLYNWLRTGAKATRGRHYELVQDIRTAEASCCVGCLAEIQKAAKGGSWQASAWILERTRPHEYSLVPARFAKEERERLDAAGIEAQVEAATQQSVEALLLEIATKISPEAARELLDALRAAKEK